MEIKIDVPLQVISDTLCSAFEGGSNYWYRIGGFDGASDDLTFRTDPNTVYRHLDFPLNAGHAVIIDFLEDEDRKPVRLDLDAVQRGLKLMAEKYPRHFGDMLSENGDAETGDVLLQCCVLGDVVYG